MAQAPKLILNTDGMPWGRWVQQTVQGHDTDITSLKQTVASGAAVQNSQLKQIAGQIATLSSQQAQLTSVVSHLGNLVRSTGATTSGFSWSGLTTWNTVSASLAVPTGAQKVDLYYAVEAVFCSNSSLGSANGTYVAATVPSLGLTSDTGPEVIVQNNEQQQRVRNYVATQQDVTSVTTLTFNGEGASANSGTNTNNSLKITALAIFSF